MFTGSCRDSPVVKSNGCCSRWPRCDSQYPHGNSWPELQRVWWSPWSLQLHVVQTQVQIKHSCTQNKIKNLIIYKERCCNCWPQCAINVYQVPSKYSTLLLNFSCTFPNNWEKYFQLLCWQQSCCVFLLVLLLFVAFTWHCWMLVALELLNLLGKLTFLSPLYEYLY